MFGFDFLRCVPTVFPELGLCSYLILEKITGGGQTARNFNDKRINTQIATLNQVAASGSSKIKKPKNKQETTTDPKKKRDQRYDALKEGHTKQQFI